MPEKHTLEDHKNQIRKQLRKRTPLTLLQIANGINWDVSTHALARPISELVASGEAVRHPGRPATYTKP